MTFSSLEKLGLNSIEPILESQVFGYFYNFPKFEFNLNRLTCITYVYVTNSKGEKTWVPGDDNRD
jgi:hypothetical protein